MALARGDRGLVGDGPSIPHFGSLDAVRQRWRAAVAAGVDFIATDQYEEFADDRRREAAVRRRPAARPR